MKRFIKLLKYKTRFGSPNPYILTGRGEKSSEKGIDPKLSNDERKNSSTSPSADSIELEEARVAKNIPKAFHVGDEVLKRMAQFKGRGPTVE